MSNRYKRYSKQFKKDAVAYVRDHSDLSVNAAAINLGVAPSTLGKWIKKANAGEEIHRGSGNYLSDEAKENVMDPIVKTQVSDF